MLTLHPPFRAESMEGLYQKVIKGQFGRINPRYSDDIYEMIKYTNKILNCIEVSGLKRYRKVRMNFTMK